MYAKSECFSFWDYNYFNWSIRMDGDQEQNPSMTEPVLCKIFHGVHHSPSDPVI